MKIIQKIKDYFVKNFVITITESEPGFLFGVDLSEWRYLGHTQIGSRYKDYDVLSHRSIIYYFVGKIESNADKRKFIHVGDDVDLLYHEKNHHHVVISNEWAMGEHSLSYPVISSPSTWLRNYMNQRGFVWNDLKPELGLKLGAFLQTQNKESQKYNEALKKQKEGSKSEINHEDNIISLNFKKE